MFGRKTTNKISAYETSLASLIEAPGRKAAVTVADIHNDFDTIAEREMLEISKDGELITKEDRKKLLRLQDMGFWNSSTIKSVSESINKEAMGETRKAAIELYAKKYPLHKVIFIEQINALCEKYGLLWGGANRFTGDIPKKNVAEITDFKEKRDVDEYSEWHIAAPPSQMNQERSRIEGHQIVQDDPIVLLRVRHDCFIIVSKWGVEAADPIVLNEKHN